ncbi:ribosome assembly cofactor RimP [Sphaerochaeta sp. PS]|uniref:ribosome assembly cofactor RimP n=1 Tax=Sphaerochaeta sp. PS TaxID=3076336 RepID=UPI0028A3915C|nr:ribosome assembly cofactor RimP [Sphaerochaeta sp. PS]MDT4761484.1 ribosome assembly cofactor RimP [Sphaerochaeta sp. PS]
MEALGITIVDINRVDRGFGVGVTIIIMTKDHEVTVADCSKVYKLVYPRMELQLGERDLHIEVSTPGLQRTIKDVYEFSLFGGKRVRVYDTKHEEWVSGLITDSDDASVTLASAYIGDSKEMIETMVVDFSRIQKAKLDYRWEDNSNGN